VTRVGKGWRKLGRAEIFWLVVFWGAALLTCLSGCNVDDSGTGSPLVVPDPATGRPAADAGAGPEAAADQVDQVDAGGVEAAAVPGPSADAGPEAAPGILPECVNAQRVIVCAIGASRGTCKAYVQEQFRPAWGCFIRDDNDWHFVCVEACP